MNGFGRSRPDWSVTHSHRMFRSQSRSAGSSIGARALIEDAFTSPERQLMAFLRPKLKGCNPRVLRRSSKSNSTGCLGGDVEPKHPDPEARFVVLPLSGLPPFGVQHVVTCARDRPQLSLAAAGDMRKTGKPCHHGSEVRQCRRHLVFARQSTSNDAAGRGRGGSLEPR